MYHIAEDYAIRCGSDNQRRTLRKLIKISGGCSRLPARRMNKVWKKTGPSSAGKGKCPLGESSGSSLPEKCPHRGGWWERVCRSFEKNPQPGFRKILGKALLTLLREMYDCFKRISKA